MQYTKIAFASILYLLLCACNSNQVAEINETVTSKLTGSIDNTKLSGIPTDGKLRDEHLRMYVSTQIIQEQIRYQNATSGTVVDNAIKLEEMAINHFEFDSQLYHWVKRTINETSQSYTDTIFIATSNTSNQIDSMVAHNQATVKKFEDELEFVKKYKLYPKLAKPFGAALKDTPKRQAAFPPNTSS